MEGGGIEVACDESGSEGERLIGGNTDVFAHAGVRLSPAEADARLAEVRRRVPTPASEFFAGHILREKHLGALHWSLGPDGPFHGLSQVYLVDKTHLLLSRLLALDNATAASTAGVPRDAVVLQREGPAAYGPGRWSRFLASANELLRTTNGRVTRPKAAPFPQAVAELRATAHPGGRLGALVADLTRAAPSMDAAHQKAPPGESVLDPMVPAVIAAIAYWSGRSPDGRVAIVHDRQTWLTPDRVALIRARAAGRLTRLSFAVSGEDARIQLADVLAGVARRLASDHLAGHADRTLIQLLSPYVDPASIYSRPFWESAPRPA